MVILLAPYLIPLALYIGFACLVWSISIALLIPERTRRVGIQIAAGMAGSFPGVFLFQALSFPMIGKMVLFISSVIWLTQPTEIPTAFLLGWLGLIICVLFALASLLGFYVGWRLAWEIASARSVRELITSGRLVRPIPGGLRSSVAGWKASLET